MSTSTRAFTRASHNLGTRAVGNLGEPGRSDGTFLACSSWRTTLHAVSPPGSTDDPRRQTDLTARLPCFHNAYDDDYLYIKRLRNALHSRTSFHRPVTRKESE